MKSDLTRRGFVRAAAAGYPLAGAAALASLSGRRAPRVLAAEADKPALLGGTPVHTGGWPEWPQWNESWEPEIVEVFRSGRWSCSGGGGQVGDFETAYAKLLGAKRCVATASGTTALITAMHVMGVDAGDEVITSPYTFIATYNTILMLKALPVFADTDPATLTMDPASIESRITDRTRAIVPVHIYGLPCDMDPINAIAEKHNLAVVEDACQAWLGQYKGRKCGTLGDLGCFSFQNSKHIPAGEGGAIVGNDDHLTAGLKEIHGIQPVRLPEDSRAVWHLYAFRYDADQFHGLPRNKFIRALRAEGIPASSGYHEQYNDGLLDEAINSQGFKRLFPAARLKAYRDSFQELKGNKQVCETTVAFFQTLLLADRSDMDHIIEAVRRIHANSAALAT